jgi:tetratricopeptide (TPR) repeat protein
MGAEAGSETLVEASDLLVRSGDLETAAEAEVMIAGTVWHGADNEAVSTHLRRAEELVRDLPPSRAKAYVLAERARFHMLASEMEDAVRVARQAIPMAEELGLDDLLANGLNNLGTSLVTLGDLGGLDDLRRSVELAERSGSPFEITRANVNLASILGQLGRVEAGLAYKEKASGVARRFGLIRVIQWLVGEKAVDDYLTGAWDDAVSAAESLIGLAASGTPHYMESICLQVRSVIRVARGDDQGAVEDAEAGLVRSSPDPQQLWEALAVRAYVASELGDAREAERRSGELLELWRGPLGLLAGNWAVNLAVVLVALGRGADLLDAAARDPAPTRWLDGSKAYAVGDFARAAEIFGEIPSRPHAALADLHAAEAALASGNRAEADFHLQRALAFWRSVGATRYVREGEVLLAESA